MKQVIVMAAGMGARMKELTKEIPKPLIKIEDKPMLEINIEYMIDAGIDRVVIIVGYFKEKFIYLKEKYRNQIEILFIENHRYANTNTIYSLFCACNEFICDSYITTADNYLLENLYIKYQADYSFYLLRPVQHFQKEEWVVSLDTNMRFLAVDLHGHDGNSYSGVSFWKHKDLLYIKKCLETIDWSREQVKKMYWDNILLPHLDEFPIYAKIMEDNREFYEVDDIDDLRTLEIYLKGKGNL